MPTRIALLFLWALLPATGWGETLRIATLDNNPPYSVVEASGAIAGFERELGDILCAEAAVDCHWETGKAGALIPGLVSGTYDAVLAALPSDGAYPDEVALTQAYLYPDVYGIVGISGSELAFGAGKIAVLPGRDLGFWAADSGRTLVEYSTLDAAVAALLDGQVDGILAPKALLAPVVSGSGGTFDYIYTDQKFTAGRAMAFRADDVDLRFSIEDALFAISEDGRLGALVEAWFGASALGG